FAHCVMQPPGVTRRVALPWPALASSPRPESGLSSRPFRLRGADRRSPGSPAEIIIRDVRCGIDCRVCRGAKSESWANGRRSKIFLLGLQTGGENVLYEFNQYSTDFRVLKS